MKKETPKCRKCKNKTIWANAGVCTDIPYLYCKSCKVEVCKDGWEISIQPKTIKESTSYTFNGVNTVYESDSTYFFYPPNNQD